MASWTERIRKSVNAFLKTEDERTDYRTEYGAPSYTPRPDRGHRRYTSNDRTIIGALYNRIALDVAAIGFRHARVDSNGSYAETIKSELNRCLTVEANIDQGARHFKQDVALSLFEEGVIAIIPIDITKDPSEGEGYDILSLRVGRITEWYPRHVRLEAWNDKTGKRETLFMSKRMVAIVENPLFQVMNEPNGTLQRLLRKLSLLDMIDEQSGSGKLDIIIQMPHDVRSDVRKTQAEERRRDVETQLKDAQYGIAYIGANERVTQLNRPAENNMLSQIKLLLDQVYAQLGLTADVFNGTADEEAMINYHNRTIEPIATAIKEAMHRTFLTKTAHTQGQAIVAIRDPFKLVPVSQLAEIADKFTRNEILSSNEVRGIIGFSPSDDPKADELRNKNLPAPGAQDIGELKPGEPVVYATKTPRKPPRPTLLELEP